MHEADSCFRVSWNDETGLAGIDWAPGAVCGIEEARTIDLEIESLHQGPVRCLVNLRGVDSIDRPARQYFIHSPLYAAVALVTDSVATRVLANFFLRMKREATPARIFTDGDEAVAWLRTHG